MRQEEVFAFIREYEALWQERGTIQGRRKRSKNAIVDADRLEAIRTRQLALCDVIAPYYAQADEPYRLAMWERRAWLHLNRRCGEVYDGTDALDWKRAFNNGQCPPSVLVNSTIAQPVDLGAMRATKRLQANTEAGVSALREVV